MKDQLEKDMHKIGLIVDMDQRYSVYNGERPLTPNEHPAEQAASLKKCEEINKAHLETIEILRAQNKQLRKTLRELQQAVSALTAWVPHSEV